jgi:hypothetical protein
MRCVASLAVSLSASHCVSFTASLSACASYCVSHCVSPSLCLPHPQPHHLFPHRVSHCLSLQMFSAVSHPPPLCVCRATPVQLPALPAPPGL